MPAPFAALEARVNSVVFARLPNVVASIDGGEPFGAIFEDAYAVGNVGALGMASSQPVMVVPSARVPAGAEGRPVIVDGVSYRIGTAEPDGGGTVRLMLEAVLP